MPRALEHGGALPKKVEIIKQWYSVPTPEAMRKIGPYKPEDYLAKHGKQKLVYTAHCAREPDAQPTNEQRLRHDRLATVVGLVGGLAVAEAVALLANTAPASGPERAALLALAVVASSAAALWILARTDR